MKRRNLRCQVLHDATCLKSLSIGDGPICGGLAVGGEATFGRFPRG